MDVDDNFIYLLVEEYDYAINRGRIAKISIDRKTLTIIDCVILLDLPTHLSFPVIYRRNGKIYVAPENNCSGGFYIYEYDLLQEKMVKLKELCHRRLTDAIIFENENGFHLLTTYEPKPNGCLLSIFHSDDFFYYDERLHIVYEDEEYVISYMILGIFLFLFGLRIIFLYI